MIFAEIKSPARWSPDLILGFIWPFDHKPQCRSSETRPWTTGEHLGGPCGPSCGASPVEENEDPSPKHRAVTGATVPTLPSSAKAWKKRLEYFPQVFQRLAASPEMSTLSSESRFYKMIRISLSLVEQQNKHCHPGSQRVMYRMLVCPALY